MGKKINVSIIMGIYNCKSTLEQSIESILKQTYCDWQLIMCDDGSTDGSLEIAQKYADDNDNIILIKNEKNMGLAYSLNKCIEISKGKYIARMDGDDICLPDRLKKQVEYLDKNKDISIIGSNVYYFNNEGIFGKSRLIQKPTYIDICCGRMFVHPSTMIKKEALVSVGGYVTNELTYRAEDYDLWCRMYYQGMKGHNMDDFLLKYRLDNNAYKKRKYKYRIDEYKLKKYWIKRFNLDYKNYIYFIKPLIVGLIPSTLMQKYHNYTNKKSYNITVN